jgi:hypothetical protein
MITFGLMTFETSGVITALRATSDYRVQRICQDRLGIDDETEGKGASVF